jgi:hypothetical protein
MAAGAANKSSRAKSAPADPEQNGHLDERVATLEDLVAANTHRVHLPSGLMVVCNWPDEADMLLEEDLPQRLMDAATRAVFREIDAAQEPGDGDAEPAEEEDAAQLASAKALAEARAQAARLSAAYRRHMAMSAVVEPKLTEDAWRRMPEADKDMLAALAGRERETDALGRIVGVRALDPMSTFCARHERTGVAGCQACAKKRQQVSRSLQGQV